ncbi:MAG: hypothetical protein H6620_12130 [Halobacteriovoraceae bacterium]|nr:hypothetical protein [Halobacteriovoraceae bacterium]
MKWLLPLFSSSLVFAAGGAHGGVSDLLAPLINFLIFAGILIYFAGPKIKAHFVGLSEETQIILDRANKKARESEVLLAEQEKKHAELGKTIDGIFNNVDNQVKDFEAQFEKETEEKLVKLEKDGEVKIETEKKQILDGLSQEVLDAVIAKAKEKIKADASKQSQVTEDLLKGLQL